MNQRRISDIYDQRAPRYDASVGLVERWLVGELRRGFGAALRGETLEVAVGSGMNLPLYGDRVTRAVGIDLSGGMLAEARAKAGRLNRSIQLARMDAHHLAFPDASFDTVAVSLALCTVPDPVAALREMARVCRPGGRVVLLEHVLSPYRPIAWLERLWSPLNERAIGCCLTRRTIETARDLGFVVDGERTRFFGVFRLAVLRPPGYDTRSA